MLAFRNGALVPAADLALSPADAGFVTGATVTDFCRTYAGRLFRWPAHLDRLRRHAAALGLPLPYPDDVLTQAAETLVRVNRAGGEELALVTFATPGPLGHLLGEPADGPPTVGMHTAPLAAERYRRFRTAGVTLEHVGDQPDGWLGVKHRSRLHWWLAGRQTTVPGAVAVLTGPCGVADTAVGCVLAVAGDVVLGPPAGAALESVTAGLVRELCGGRWREEAVDFRTPPASVTGWLLAGSGLGLAAVRRTVVGGAVREWPDQPGLLAAWRVVTGEGPGEPRA
jgi:branched-subunit amino acid aminotransferase/4-amino-4-deoxychorismate lyase